jgi:hypothetical protein
MERNELLNNLYSARNLIGNIFQEKDTLDNICASYEGLQEEISTKGVVNKGKIILNCSIVAYGVILLMRMQWFFLICLILYGIAKLKGKTESKFYKLLDIIFKIQGIYLIYACITSPQLIPAYILLFGIAGIISAVIIISKNKSVRKTNELAEQKNNELHIQYGEHRAICDGYQNELANLTQSWFPQSYLSADCVDYFISAMESYRADSVKELINLYEQEMHNRRMEEMQNTVIQQNEIMIREQKRANMYQLFQIGQHAYTHSLLQRECNELSNINGNLSNINKNAEITAAAMDKLVNGIEHTRF